MSTQVFRAPRFLSRKLVGVDEDFRMVGAIDGIDAEQSAEEQDLGQEEDPHAQLAGVELLPVGAEMVGQEMRLSGGVRFVMGSIGVVHKSGAEVRT